MNERINKKIPFHKPGSVLQENPCFLKMGTFPLLSHHSKPEFYFNKIIKIGSLPSKQINRPIY